MSYWYQFITKYGDYQWISAKEMVERGDRAYRLINYGEAFEWYMLAAERGYPEAYAKVAKCYEEGKGASPSTYDANQWYEKAAKNGEVQSMVKAAQSAYNDYEKKHWYEKAAEKGNEEAIRAMGDMYYKGMNIFTGEFQDSLKKPNYEKAAYYYEKISWRGDKEVQFRIGMCYLLAPDKFRNEYTAVRYLGKAAEQGHAEAQFELGKLYENGKGCTRDYKKALELYEKAARQKFIGAPYRIGLLYKEGKGVEKNAYTAKYWFEKEFWEHRPANYELGLCYYYGRGAAKDWKKAAEHFERGEGVESTYMYAVLVEKGYASTTISNATNLEKSIKYYRMAAEAGHAEAQFKLGYCYASGQGVSYADKKAATEWYLKAALQGHVDAMNNLGLLQLNQKDNFNSSGSLQVGVLWRIRAAEKGSEESKKWLERIRTSTCTDDVKIQYAIGDIYEGRIFRDVKNLWKALEWYKIAAGNGNTWAKDGVERVRKLL